MTFEYEVRLVLAREAIGPSRLGEGSDVRLGWNSFLTTEPATADRDDASYELHTIH
jgi:type VI secretion system protein ImpH